MPVYWGAPTFDCPTCTHPLVSWAHLRTVQKAQARQRSVYKSTWDIRWDQVQNIAHASRCHESYLKQNLDTFKRGAHGLCNDSTGACNMAGYQTQNTHHPIQFATQSLSRHTACRAVMITWTALECPHRRSMQKRIEAEQDEDTTECYGNRSTLTHIPPSARSRRKMKGEGLAVSGIAPSPRRYKRPQKTLLDHPLRQLVQ